MCVFDCRMDVSRIARAASSTKNETGGPRQKLVFPLRLFACFFACSAQKTWGGGGKSMEQAMRRQRSVIVPIYSVRYYDKQFIIGASC